MVSIAIAGAITMIGAMSFSVFMDGFVLSAVMRAILFSFVLCFMISAIVRVVTAGIVMGVTVSVGKRDWNSGTKHQSQRKKRRNDFTCEFLCHGIIPPMNQNSVCYMTSIRYGRKMKGR